MIRSGPGSLLASLALAAAPADAGQPSFVNWESPHVHPIDVTPDETRLLAVNTPDNRLEIFDITGDVPASVGAVAVGLDPVSVRALDDQTAWVINRVSDSVSIVDLSSVNVVATLETGDEPADVVFASGRAFVTLSQPDQVLVYDLAGLDAAPDVLEIEGEHPRALATDGVRVYAALFESGNASTIIPPAVVSSDANPYEGNPNPPPNDGDGFSPPADLGNPPAPPVAHIVQRDELGQWVDDNGADWSDAVAWDLLDHDVAIIDAATLEVTYQSGLMNMDMALAVRPDGQLTVVGTEATNVIRFEPNINGTFVRVMMAEVDPEGLAEPVITDLNPHLDYTASAIAPEFRELSVGDPRAIAWTADGLTGYVAGMGSNNVIVIDAGGARLAEIEVGEGPTGVALVESGEATGRLYVMNRFEGAISVVDLATNVESDRVWFHDPTPVFIREGRPFLYDTHLTSGLGQASCASCHVDGRTDAVAWDLGNPEGAVTPFSLDFCVANACDDWHPMKGPMMTQTLVGSLTPGVGALHWRGDRATLDDFNIAFELLMGDTEQLTPDEMQKFEDFIASLTPPPNPHRLTDNSLDPVHPNGGDAFNGSLLFKFGNLAAPLNCNNCHTLPPGTDGLGVSPGVVGASQTLKVPHLRNLYRKTGLDFAAQDNTRGFGFRHDGSVDSIISFFETAPHFTFDPGKLGDEQMVDLEAYLLSFSTDTHAGVGTQLTLASAQDAADNDALVQQMQALAEAGDVGPVLKGVVAGEQRGYFLSGPDGFQSDRSAEVVTFSELTAGLAPGAELTFTLVPAGTEIRIGVDRDEDGFFDGDELAVCADAADPGDFPGAPGNADVNADLEVNILDFVAFQDLFDASDPAADVNEDGEFNILDFTAFQSIFAACS